jgi:hypothetical protein
VGLGSMAERKQRGRPVMLWHVNQKLAMHFYLRGRDKDGHCTG